MLTNLLLFLSFIYQHKLKRHLMAIDIYSYNSIIKMEVIQQQDKSKPVVDEAKQQMLKQMDSQYIQSLFVSALTQDDKNFSCKIKNWKVQCKIDLQKTIYDKIVENDVSTVFVDIIARLLNLTKVHKKQKAKLSTIIKGFQQYYGELDYQDFPINTILQCAHNVPLESLQTYFDIFGKKFVERNKNKIQDMLVKAINNQSTIRKISYLKVCRAYSDILNFVFSKDLFLENQNKHQPSLTIKEWYDELTNIYKKEDLQKKHFNGVKVVHNKLLKKKQNKPKQENPRLKIKLCVRHFLKTMPFPAVEDKFRSIPKYLELLIELLVAKKQFMNAAHIIYAYQVKSYRRNSQISNVFLYSNQTLVNQKNHLMEYDYFGPTEAYVLKNTEESYLELIQFGIEQKDVIFIDSVQKDFEQAYITLIQSTIIAFDVEMAESSSSISKSVAQTLQISNQNKIFIFDIPRLAKERIFQSLLLQLFYSESDQIVLGYDYKGDVTEINNILLDYDLVGLKEIVDLQPWGIKNYGKSLKDCAQKIFGKSFSKYEQCSGWNNRPLRKAQIHYAALDAFVLIKIFIHYIELTK